MADTTTKSVLLVGGGHTHALVLNALKSNPIAGAHVTVINPGATAPYSGMLPGFVAGHYTRAELDIDLAALCAQVGATLIDGRAVALSPQDNQVQLEDGQSLAYDVASFDVGITSRMDSLPGFTECAVPAKPLGVFSEKWDAFRHAPGSKQVAIIGGGIAGAELAMAMAYALKQQSDNAKVRLLDRGEILSTSTARTQKRIRNELGANGVELHENVDVTAITKSAVQLQNGAEVAADFIVGAAGATPHAWVTETGLKLHNGFIVVDETLRTSAGRVFAVGDCAHMAFDPRPKAGVFAVRQAPVLLRNLAAAVTGADLHPFAPQADYLKLVSLGGKRAYGEKNGWAASGHLMWRLKDRIDRTFMNQF